jgi:hypothetical protein
VMYTTFSRGIRSGWMHHATTINQRRSILDRVAVVGCALAHASAKIWCIIGRCHACPQWSRKRLAE